MLGYKLHEFATSLTYSLLVRRASLLGTAVLARGLGEYTPETAESPRGTHKGLVNDVSERGTLLGAAGGLLLPLRTGGHAQRRNSGGAALPTAHRPRQRSPGEPSGLNRARGFSV